MIAKNKDLRETILARENMDAAWEQVRANKGAPGLDGVTVRRWARNWEANIERLRDQARRNIYKPNRPRRCTVRKKGGGVRELSMLTIADKVLQRAVLNVIEEMFDERFLKCSHGYRPRRSVATAVHQVLMHRDRGLRQVFDADIRACFDSLDHGVLMGLVQRVLRDHFTLNLMEMWLKAGRKCRSQATGVPLGAVLSPLWCNIYLHQLDARLSCTGWKVVRYADDFVIMTATDEQAREAQQIAEAILGSLKLVLAPEKTRIASFQEGFIYLGVSFYKDSYTYIWEEKRIQV